MPSEQGCLHIVARPLTSEEWQQCLAVLSPHCAIVFLDPTDLKLANQAPQLIYQLIDVPDSDTNTPPGVIVLNYSGLVELATNFCRSRTW